MQTILIELVIFAILRALAAAQLLLTVLNVTKQQATHGIAIHVTTLALLAPF